MLEFVSLILFMNRFAFILILAGFVFLSCGGAVAATHEHHITAHHSASLFDKNSAEHKSHCTLRGHDISQICPKKISNNSIKELISSDCRTYPSDTSSDVTVNHTSSLLTMKMQFQAGLLLNGNRVTSQIYKTLPKILSVIEHPPKFSI